VEVFTAKQLNIGRQVEMIRIGVISKSRTT